MSISDNLSEAIQRAFRAALLLTGSTGLAEAAVSAGIAELDITGDIELTLLTKTVESLRQHSGYADRLERSLARLPQELQWLIHLPPDARDCFLLRLLFGIPAASAAMLVKLTTEEFDESLGLALRQLPVLGCSNLALRPDASHTAIEI